MLDLPGDGLQRAPPAPESHPELDAGALELDPQQGEIEHRETAAGRCGTRRPGPWFWMPRDPPVRWVIGGVHPIDDVGRLRQP